MKVAEFRAAWPEKFRGAASKEGWALGIRGNGGVRLLYISQDLWPDAGKIQHTVVYGHQPHHFAARGLLKGSSRWPSIVRGALAHRVSEGL